MASQVDFLFSNYILIAHYRASLTYVFELTFKNLFFNPQNTYVSHLQ